MSLSTAETTRLLNALGEGERRAADELVPALYDDLRRLAGAFMSRERRDHTLQTTALVHEAYLRLIDQRELSQLGRAEFVRLVARTLRRVLLDHAEAAGALKRGGGSARVTLSETLEVTDGEPLDVLALEEALGELERLEPRHARMVELKFFAGLSNEEVAIALAVSPSTVEKDWRFVRAWLRRRLEGSTRAG